MNRNTSARAAQSAWLFCVVLSVGCQKKDTSAPCGTSVAGGDTITAGTSSGVGVAGATSVGGSGGESAVGGTNQGGAVGLGMGGSGAAAATGGLDGLGGSGGAPPPDSTACAALAVTDCATGTSCQGLSGQKISGDPQCLSAFAVVACGTTVGCMPMATRATDHDGHDWVFPSTCIPAGWTNSSSSGTRFDACMVVPDGGPAN